MIPMISKVSQNLTEAQRDVVEWINAVDQRTQEWIRLHHEQVKKDRDQAIAFLGGKLAFLREELGKEDKTGGA
jgi:hypothetical protein